MQTFLPYKSFYQSALCLDMRRLNNQLNEAKVLINAISGKTKAYRNHPAARMWENHLEALKMYHDICLEVWIERRKATGEEPKTSRTFYSEWGEYGEGGCDMPLWLGGPIHDAHKAKLFLKDPEYYHLFNTVEADPEYWPV